MLQLDLFDTTTSTTNHEITISPAQHEIMQALVSGDLQRATQLIDLQHDTDLDLQQEAAMQNQIQETIDFIKHLKKLMDNANNLQEQDLLAEAIASAEMDLMHLGYHQQKPNIIGVGIGSTP